MRQPIFEFNPSQGSFKDKISGAVPVNTNCSIKNGQKGRVLDIPNGNNDGVNFGNLSSLNLGNSNFTIEIWIKGNDPGAIFLKDTVAGAGKGVFVYASANYQYYNGSSIITIGQLCTCWTHLLLVREGQGTNQFKTYYNNTAGGVGEDSRTLSNTKNLVIGNDTDGGYNGNNKIGRIAVYDYATTTQERETLYQRFLNAQTQLVSVTRQKALVEGSDDSDVFISENGLSWNADGVTKSAGQFVGDWRVDSGSFRIKEDATGKYIDCVTNGTISLEGINLSDIVGSGFIKKLDGSLSSDAGDTIDNATNVSFANNKVTATLTAGQVIRNFLLTRGS